MRLIISFPAKEHWDRDLPCAGAKSSRNYAAEVQVADLRGDPLRFELSSPFQRDAGGAPLAW